MGIILIQLFQHVNVLQLNAVIVQKIVSKKVYALLVLQVIIQNSANHLQIIIKNVIKTLPNIILILQL